MFGGTLWAGGIAGIEDHLDREREPPPRPVEPEFPTYVPPLTSRKLDAATSRIARDRICHVRSFTEISDQDLSLFNIDLNYDVDISDLLPKDVFCERPLLFDEDLEAMLAEISCSNEDAFREILRMDPLPGRSRPRLAYARNFFGSLEDMARYWDASKDDYYQVPVGNKQSSSTKSSKLPNGSAAIEPKDKAKVNADVEMTDANSANASTDSEMVDPPPQMKEVYKGYRFGNGEQVNPGTRVAMVKNLLKMVMHKFLCRDHEPIPAPREKFAIRGVRVQSIQYHFCVARLPKDTKLARSRMVEGPIMAVQCREETRFKQTPQVPAADALLAGSAVIEGKVVANPANTEKPTNPKLTSSNSPFVGERYDLLREVGAMLILASQRSREGKSKDSISGADRWWVKEKRFGGGPLKWGQLSHELYEDEDPSWSPQEKRLQEIKRQREAKQREKGQGAKDLISSAEASVNVDVMLANNAPLIPATPGDPLGGPRKKKLRSIERPAGKDEEFRDGKRLMYVPPFRKKWYTDWQNLRPNTPMWDDKIIYKRIGKPEEAEFDDIYMVTSVNHHVALVQMKVHPEYLAWIESGREVPDELVDDLKKNRLHMKRSTWFDVFDPEARQKFLIALWQVMCWLNRNYIDQTVYDKMDERKQALSSS